LLIGQPLSYARGAPSGPARFEAAPRGSCSQPRDLYAAPGREALGRLLAGWLERHRVTPFELLHRADLAERLEACEAELAAALYTAALAEAADRDAPLDEVRQDLDDLARRTIAHVRAGGGDPAFKLGAAVAQRLAGCASDRDKLTVLLDLLEAAPRTGIPASISHSVLVQPIVDLVGGSGALVDILGGELELGDQLLVLVQVASAPALAAVAGGAGSGAAPPLAGLAARLAVTLHGRAAYARARRAILRRVMQILSAETPLWPARPAREAQGLETLANLLRLSRRLVDQEQLASALGRRWRRLAAAPRPRA
jgi:hypothetical protein